MNMLTFLGLLVLGFVLIIYTTPIVRILGRMEWAERLMGPTGTYGAWKMIGVGCIVAGMVILRYY